MPYIYHSKTVLINEFSFFPEFHAEQVLGIYNREGLKDHESPDRPLPSRLSSDAQNDAHSFSLKTSEKVTQSSNFFFSNVLTKL